MNAVDAPADTNRAEDCIIPQGWSDYGEREHAIWRTLFERRSRLLAGRSLFGAIDQRVVDWQPAGREPTPRAHSATL